MLYAAVFLMFCEYWPDDSLVRPKLVASNRNSKIQKVVVSEGRTWGSIVIKILRY